MSERESAFTFAETVNVVRAGGGRRTGDDARRRVDRDSGGSEPVLIDHVFASGTEPSSAGSTAFPSCPWPRPPARA